jgi:hypothetical protein
VRRLLYQTLGVHEWQGGTVSGGAALFCRVPITGAQDLGASLLRFMSAAAVSLRFPGCSSTDFESIEITSGTDQISSVILRSCLVAPFTSNQMRAFSMMPV